MLSSHRSLKLNIVVPPCYQFLHRGILFRDLLNASGLHRLEQPMVRNCQAIPVYNPFKYYMISMILDIRISESWLTFIYAIMKRKSSIQRNYEKKSWIWLALSYIQGWIHICNRCHTQFESSLLVPYLYLNPN